MRKSTLFLACIAAVVGTGCGASNSNNAKELAAVSGSGNGDPGGSGNASSGSGSGDTSMATSGSGNPNGGASTSGSGNSTAGAAGAYVFNPPPHAVGACDNLGEPGVWENITPADLHFEKWCQNDGECPAGGIPTYGAHGLAIDPTVSGKIYLGTGNLGLWKSSDCGASWIKADTGTHHEDIDGGRNWSIAIDNVNPETVWTVSGYGASGIWKSTNGGQDFQNMVTPEIKDRVPYEGFVEKITLDPKNPQHVLISFHAPCTKEDKTEYPCLAESINGGTSWNLIDSPYQPGEGDGQTMIDANTWYFGDGAGLWRTTNAGVKWDSVFDQDTSGAVYQATDGTFYTGQSNSMAHSPDGVTWTRLQNSQGGGTINGGQKMADDGTRVYTSTQQYGGSIPDTGLYYSFPLSDPTKWEPAFKPELSIKSGAAHMYYDADHHLLYSANMVWGVWRVRVPN